MQIKYAAKLPTQIPSSLNVYRLARPQAGAIQVADLSKRFGLSGKMKDFITSDDWTSYSEGRFRISVHRSSGAVRYVNRDKYGIETDMDFKLSQKETEKIAQGFLGGIQIYPAKQTQLLKVTHLRSGMADIKQKNKTERLIDAGVIYRRLVDDIPAAGPGGYAMVNVDPEGEVVGMRSVWRQTAGREAKVKIIPVGQAVEVFEKLISEVQGDVTVTTANFGYFEQSEMDKQSYLEPAYVFIYVVQNGEVAHKSIEVIAAGQKTFAKLKGKKRFDPGPQKERGASKSDQGKKPGKESKSRKR